MVVRHAGRCVILGMALLLFLPPILAVAQTMEEVKDKNRQLEAELQRMKAEYGKVLELTGPAKKELLAMAAVLAAKPKIAFDFSNHSGEMCFSPGSGDMIHYTTNPDKTTEDVIFMLKAQPFIDYGLRVADMATMPSKRGAMKPYQWYYYDGKTIEPHHGRQFSSPYPIMSLDVYDVPETK